MKATNFEYRNQVLLHLGAVTIAFLAYLVDRDDVVWALVRGRSEARLLERLAFALATLLIGTATVLRTWSRAHTLPDGWADVRGFSKTSTFVRLRYPLHIGNLLFAVGLASLAPIAGCIFLVAAETILVARLIAREKAADRERLNRADQLQPSAAYTWPKAVRLEAGKWGLFCTMIVFTLLLNDRITEMLAAASCVLWVVLNYKSCHPAMTS